jgi:hypothetical protein
MSIIDDRRLIEDYLPIQAISAEASPEKSVREDFEIFWCGERWIFKACAYLADGFTEDAGRQVQMVGEKLVRVLRFDAG